MKYQMYINGELVDSLNKKTYDAVNALTNEKMAEVPFADREDMVNAIKYASVAKKRVKDIALIDKIDLLRELSTEIKKKKESMINLLINNCGQVRKYATGGVAKASDMLENVSQQMKHLHSDVIKSNHGNKFGYTLHEPLGVIGIVVPINAPLLLPMTALSAGFASGNCSILKPAFQTPLPALEIGKMLHELGAPNGAFNIVTGEGREIGSELVNNKGVNGIIFFGSTKVGSAIGSECTKNIKKCVLNLAGKNPLIVLEDADIDRAVDTAIMDAYVNSGQICMSIEAMYVHEKIYDEFRDKLVEKTKKLKIGNPDDPETDIGPIPVAKVVEYAKKQLDDAVNKGATILTGGNITGNMIEPTVIENVKPDMEIVVERTSAPFAPLVKIKDVREAIEFANMTHHSLRAAVFTNNMRNAFKVIHELDVGNVVVNGNTFYVEEHMPHGGTNLAGMDGARYLIEEMTRRKFVMFHEIQ